MKPALISGPLTEKDETYTGVSPEFQAEARYLLAKLLQAFEQEMVNSRAENSRLRSELNRFRTMHTPVSSPRPPAPVAVAPPAPPLEAAQLPKWPEHLLDNLPTLCEKYIESEQIDQPSEPPCLVSDSPTEVSGFSPSTPRGILAGLSLELLPQPTNSGGVHVGDDELHPDLLKVQMAKAGTIESVSSEYTVGTMMKPESTTRTVQPTPSEAYGLAKLTSFQVADMGFVDKEATSVTDNGNVATHSAQVVQARKPQLSVDNAALGRSPRDEATDEVGEGLHQRRDKKAITRAIDQDLWTEAESIIKDSRLSREKQQKKLLLDGAAEREARVAAEVVAQKYQREAAVKRISRAQRNSILPPTTASQVSPLTEKRPSAAARRSGASGNNRISGNVPIANAPEHVPRQSGAHGFQEESVSHALDKFNIEVDVKEDALRLANEDLFPQPTFEEEEADNLLFHRKVARIVGHLWFDMIFAVFIILNSIFMGVQIDYSVSHPDKDTPLVFYVLGYIFTVVFLAELTLRMLSYPSFCRFVCSYDQWHWNWLDMIIVGSSLVEVVFDVIYFTSSSRNDSIDMSSMRIVRIIRLTRLLRVLRIGRIVRFIRALRILVFSILNTLRTVFWALLLLVIIIYVFGMVFAQAVSDHVSSSEDYEQTLLLYWGTLPRAIFTLFKAIASGVSWHDVVEPLAVLNPAWVGFFVIYISFTFFAVLNVITGIFCERAIESVRQDHELVVQQHLLNRALYIQTVKRLFKAIDVDDSNFISYKEFELHLRDEHAVAFFAALELETNDAWEVFRLIKSSEADGIDVDDFVEGCLRLRGAAKAIDIAKMAFETRKFHEGILRMLKTLGLAVEKTHKAVRETRLSHGSAPAMTHVAGNRKEIRDYHDLL